MRRLWRMLLASLLVFGVFAPLRALSDPTPDEIEANRATLIKLRQDPAAYAALLEQTRDFLKLPEERREQLVKLDHDLKHLEPAKHDRMMRVLKRYTAWQERLSEADREQIHDAPTAQDRLRVVRDLRERDWIRRLPKTQRDLLATLQGRARSEAIQQIRRVGLKQKQDWQLAFRFWDELIKKSPLPARLADLPPDVQTFYNEYLKPRLNETEIATLTREEGNWPGYVRTLIALSDRHPQALPGATGPKRFDDLPPHLKALLHKKIQDARPKQKPSQIDKFIEKSLRRDEGKWPAYGTIVSDLARKFGLSLPYELWPSRYLDLSPPVRKFVEKLKQVLSEEDRKRLDAAVGSWPRYPQTIQELARKHQMRVPWQALPGAAEQWNRYRARPPAVVARP